MWATTIPFLTCVLSLNQRAATDDRPELSGPEQVVESADGQFLLHYTMEGEDAVQGDMSDSGMPELVHSALDGLEIGTERFHARGYRALIGDDGVGGSDAIDVYMMEIDANGYANHIAGSDGASCYIRLDNDQSIEGITQSVAIHELHHCVQYRYTTSTDTWIYEATATFEQYRTYLDSTLQAAVIVLYSRRLGEPQNPMDWDDGEFEYAGMVAMQFWEQFRGLDPLRIPDLWEALADEPDWLKTFDAVAQENWGLSWDEAFLEYATWNAFACANDDGSGYDDSDLPCNEFVSVPFRSKKWNEGEIELKVKLPEPSHNADYWVFPDEQHLLGVQVDCEAPHLKKSEMAVRLIAIDADGNRGAHADAWADDEPLSLSMTEARDAGGTLLLIGASVGGGPLNAECFIQQTKGARSGSGCGCESGSSSGYWWFVAALAVFRRRFHAAGRPDSSSSSRNLPR